MKTTNYHNDCGRHLRKIEKKKHYKEIVDNLAAAVEI